MCRLLASFCQDVGHLLLEAQKDLARVRQRLEAMPLESNQVSAEPASTCDPRLLACWNEQMLTRLPSSFVLS